MARTTKKGEPPRAPTERETAPNATEGVGAATRGAKRTPSTAERTPPAASGGTVPARGRGASRTAAATPPDRAPSVSQSASVHRRLAGEGETLRRPALAGRTHAGARVRIEVLPPAERLSLRAPAASLAALSRALGLKLPERPKTSAAKNGRTALWLGPDEWLLIDERGGDLLAACAGVAELHSAVDVSHRNVAFAVTGPGAEATLSAGCPQDLSLAKFPEGACSRTVFGKIEIVLLRTGEQAFRLECWRSFSDYAFAFLADAARDAAA